MQTPTESTPIAQALAMWKPWAVLPNGETRQAIVDLLTASTPDERRGALERGSALFNLQNVYRAQGILRPDPGEKAKEFAALLATPSGALHAAFRGGNAPQLLALLQQCFEFGRGESHPKYGAVRKFLLEMWHLEAGGPTMKYALYPNAVLYSGGGKTHEEMAREFVANGCGAGLPQLGGQITRTGQFTFEFDMSSTAFRANGAAPGDVHSAILRWTRVTGADETKPKIVYRPQAGGR